MNFDRIKNAKRNVGWSWLNKIITLFVPFIMRTIILYTLGNMYLGLGSLFSSILQVLNLAELGIGSALAFAMYKPVAEDNFDELKELLNLYKKTYIIISIVISVFGIIMMPFLGFFIKDDIPSDMNIYAMYILYLASTVSSYCFFAYKGSILIVFQRNDILEKISIIFNLLMYSLQIIGLIVFKNYYIYIIVNLITIILKNCLISFIVKKKYPDIVPSTSTSKELTKFVFKKTGALMGHKVGAVVLNSVDNILISSILGLTLLAQYNNYYYILTAIIGILSICSSSIMPIIGNYIINEGKEKSYNLFLIILYIFSFVICICCCCFISMYQTFIEIWVKKENVLPFFLVILLVLEFYIKTYRMPILLFKDASGMWEKDLLKPWIQVIVDLIIDIILLKTIGIYGAVISTIVATFFVAYFYESYVVHKYCFQKKQKKYFINSILYFLITVFACIITNYICSYISTNNMILNLFLFLLISVFIGIVLFLLFTFFTYEFKISFTFFKRKFFRKKI